MGKGLGLSPGEGTWTVSRGRPFHSLTSWIEAGLFVFSLIGELVMSSFGFELTFELQLSELLTFARLSEMLYSMVRHAILHCSLRADQFSS